MPGLCSAEETLKGTLAALLCVTRHRKSARRTKYQQQCQPTGCLCHALHGAAGRPQGLPQRLAGLPSAGSRGQMCTDGSCRCWPRRAPGQHYFPFSLPHSCSCQIQTMRGAGGLPAITAFTRRAQLGRGRRGTRCKGIHMGGSCCQSPACSPTPPPNPPPRQGHVGAEGTPSSLPSSFCPSMLEEK